MIRHKAALGYRRYAKGHTISGETAARIEGSRGGPEPYEGTAEVWYDDMESFERSLSWDAGKIAGCKLIEDQKRFSDIAISPVWLPEEKVIKEA